MSESYQTIYEVQFAGGDQVVEGLKRVNNEAGHTVERIDKWSMAFKSVSRDIDAVGGKASSEFARWASDALGVAAAIGTGGTLGAITALSFGVGKAAEMWRAHEEAAQAAAEAAKNAASNALKHIDEAVAKAKTARNELGRAHQEDEKLWINETRKRIDEINRLEDTNRVEAVHAYHSDKEKLAKLDEEFAKLKAEKAKLDSELTLRNAAYYAREAVLAKREANEAEAAESKEKADRITKIEKEAADARKRIAEEFKQGQLQAGREILDETIRRQSEERKLDEQSFVSWDAAATALKRDTDHQNENFRARLKNEVAVRAQNDALDEQARRLDQQRTAQGNATVATIMASQVNTNYAAAMYVASNATSFATSELRQFGDVNRQTDLDIRSLTKNSVDSFVARAQAAIFNMGLESATKAQFEAAEVLKEEALGFGNLAIGNLPGASANFTSAATHAAASAAYSIIGGGAIGASFAIGATRGKGGLFGLGNEKNAAAPASGGGGGGTSSGGGGGYGGSSWSGSANQGRGNGAVNVTFVYDAGSINVNDDKRAARGVARVLGAVQRDGFARRAAR